MSPRYDRLIDEQVADQDLLAESIPHLLHQDLAYRWVLSLDRHHRPEVWRERIEAWRNLLNLFLIGELELERIDASRYPLGRLLDAAGLSTTYWLRTRAQPGDAEASRIVGVTSPTTIVRPLPTFTAEIRDLIARTLATRRRPDELKYFVALAAQKLIDIGGEQATALAKIIENEFAVDRTADLVRQRSGTHHDFPLLRQIDWSGKSEFDSIALFTRRDQESAWAPQCGQCNAFLTSRESDPPHDVPVGASTITVPCRCGKESVIELKQLRIWQRNSSETVVWLAAAGLTGVRAPNPAIDTIDVTYEWTAAELRGDIERRWLRLRFAGRGVMSVHPEDCFFKRLVVLGPRSSFSGLPIRPEWLDAVADPAEMARSVTHRENVSEYLASLKGYPGVIRQRYPIGDISHHPTAAIGVFPNPKMVGSDWRRYRAFVAGTKVVMPAPALGWKSWFSGTTQSDEGCPPYVCVVEVEARASGATCLCPVAVTTPGGRATVAIDFGTSNTLVYSRTDDVGISAHDAIKPAESVRATWWHGAEHAGSGPILPPERLGGRDGAIIPSALWMSEGAGVIRWSGEAPAENLIARTGFKWDARHIDEDLTEYRRTFLLEVLNTTLPVLAARLGLPIREIDLGVTFPLAFDHEHKERFSSLLDRLRADVTLLFGINVVSVYSINESAACVAAFGTHAEGETFLIADMGGGTLDLALLTMVHDNAQGVRPEIRQIGSLRLGGEEFVRALARSARSASNSEQEWIIRDRVSAGDADGVYGRDPRVKRMLQRFTSIAFEYLRTMILSHRRRNEADSINLLLVGNGWHLVDAFSEERREKGPARVWKEYYEHVLRQLGIGNVTLYLDPDLRVPSKHLAAIGALKNVTTSRRRDLADESEPVRLPSGRSLRFGNSSVPWYALVGNGVPLDVAAEDVRAGKLTIEPSGAEFSPAWAHYFSQSFGVQSIERVPVASESRIRERLAQNLRPTGPTLAVGPLQVIVEDSWLPTLVDVH